MSLFRAPEKNKRVLMFHVGSGSIIASHVLLEPRAEGVIPEVQKTVIVSLPVAPILDGAALVLSMKTALRKSAELIVAEQIGSPDEIICFLESPWYASQVRTIHITKNVPFLVTKKLIKELVKKETDLFEREELASYKDGVNDSTLIEREIDGIYLNGYPTSDPYGKKVQELDLSVLLSFAPVSLISEIQREVGAIFHRTDITFHSFAYAGSSVTQDLFLSHDQFLFADIGGEMTDIVLVKDNAYREAVSFPYGVRTLLRSVAQKLSISTNDAETLISLYVSQKLESSRALKFERALGPILGEWTRNFEISLEKLATKFAVPHTVALIVDPHVLPLFKQAILDESFAQHILSPEPFAVVPLSEIDWREYARQTVLTHPRSSIGALLLAKQMNNKIN